MVKKSKGFSWGPAATGCSYWTGVRMSTLLRLAGVHTPDKVRIPRQQPRIRPSRHIGDLDSRVHSRVSSSRFALPSAARWLFNA